MTDRELIELAAKAAGIDVWRGAGHQSDKYFSPANSESGVVSGVEWNPLESDADAFRLAVKLEMKVYVGEAYPWCKSSADYRNGACVCEDEIADPYAATRRAITMAAAEIAKERTS